MDSLLFLQNTFYNDRQCQEQKSKGDYIYVWN